MVSNKSSASPLVRGRTWGNRFEPETNRWVVTRCNRRDHCRTCLWWLMLELLGNLVRVCAWGTGSSALIGKFADEGDCRVSPSCG